MSTSITLASIALTLPTPQQPVAAEGIKQLPSDILANIASFLPTKARLSTMRQVCKEWSNLPFDGGHLDFLNVKNLSDHDLRNILDGIEKRGGSITSLNLYACNITDAGFAHLAKLPLTSLNLPGGRSITVAGLAHLAKLPLTSLNLYQCNITDAGLAHLAKLPLTSLYLGLCNITDTGLAHLAKLPLTSLDLSWSNITDAGFAHLAKLPLTSLNLCACRNITDTDTGLAHLAKLPLTSLDLSWSNITDAGLAHLAKLPLTSLNLCACRNIADTGLAHLAKLPLTSLELSRSNITDAGLAHLTKLPLTTLSLRLCNITDAGLAHLAELPLTTLSLHRCQNITDAGLAHLAKLPFTALELSECNITDVSLAHLANLPLTSLYLAYCNYITDAGARAFKAGLIPPALTDVRLREKTDHYIYVLASLPKGGDRWGEIHRYQDHNRLRLAQAIAAQTLNSQSFKDSWLEKSLTVIEIIDLKGLNVFTEAQKTRINALLGEIPANIRSDVDYQVYTLAPEPKGGENWGQLHRYDNLSRLRTAVIKGLENSLFTTFPIKPKTGLRILGKG